MGDSRIENLLQKVLDENRRLRESMEARDEQNKWLLKELSSNADCPTSRKESGPRKRKQVFRKMYKALKMDGTFQGFVVNKCISTQANQDVTKSVVEAIVADHGGNNKCPWSSAELKGAAATYFKSLQDTCRRVSNGKQEDHKVVCGRQVRLRDKKDRRHSMLLTMSWSEEKKAVISRALTLAYISSDESDLSEDENGKVVLKGYLVKKLPWERSTLTNIKQKLDRAYLKSLQPRIRAIVLERRQHPVSSTRGHPVDPIDWAVRTEQQDRAMPYTSTPSATTGTSTSSSSTTELSVASQSPVPQLPVTPRSLTTPTSRRPANLQGKHVKSSVATKKKSGPKRQ